MRILALTWTTFDSEKELMINQRGDMVCPAVDGITNELLNLGHQVVYVNLFPQDTDCISHISGLPYYKWDRIKNRDFDLVWHAIKDPTPADALPEVDKVMAEFNGIPVLNDAHKLADHTKRKYISVLREKNVGAIILDDYKVWLDDSGNIDYATKCHPPSNGAYVSLDKHAIRVSNRNSQRKNLNDDGITLKYHDTSRRVGAKKGMRSFFRVPYAAGKCMTGWMYYCPVDVMCPKSGAAVEKKPFDIPDMQGGQVAAGMKELGVDIAHVEGVEAGFAVEVFDVNPFPSSHGASLTPMSKRIAKRIEQVYNV